MAAGISGNDNAKRLSEDEVLYIQKMLSQLLHMSEKDDADMLCYFIDMAYLEAVALHERMTAQKQLD